MSSYNVRLCWFACLTLRMLKCVCVCMCECEWMLLPLVTVRPFVCMFARELVIVYLSHVDILAQSGAVPVHTLFTCVCVWHSV